MALRARWTPEDDAVLRTRYADTPAVELAIQLDRTRIAIYARARLLGLEKPEAYREVVNRKMGSRAAADPRSQGNRFPRGHRPWNKGMKGLQAGGRSRETQFKPGQRPQTWVPVGTERLDPDGYLKRKIRDDAPPGMSRRNWKYVHVLLWEQHHGPVPKGHNVVFRNGDKTDIRIDNLELLTRRANMLRNSMHTIYPPELVQVIQLNGALKRKIRNRDRDREAA